MSKTIDIVFDGPPSHESGRFIEVEDDSGHSIGDVGEWIYRADGYWVLRMPDPRAQSAELAELRKDAERLDAIEANNWYLGKTPTNQWSVIRNQCVKIGMHPTLRAAIDAAIKEQKHE